VEDAELKAYLDENPNRYKVQDNRSVEYVQWQIKPSGEDSALFSKELEEIRSDFATAQNDTQFAASASDAPVKLQTLSADQLPAELAPQVTSLKPGEVYGPFAANSALTLYKVISVGAEGDMSIKASHILFGIGDKSDTAKASAKAKANAVLEQIKGGAPFELMAQIHGTDGTKEKGGDLGWFGRGRMVKPFDEAVFGHPAVGLLPNLVETDFGYHIVKVTAAPTNIKYKVVSIQKNISAGDKAREDLYAKANQFKATAADQASFDAEIKKENLKKEVAASIFKNGNGVNDISEAREIVRWAYSDDAKLGEVSKVFELNDRYVVAVLTKITEEGQASVADVREALTTEVRKRKKAAAITTKLGTGTLEQMQQRYGKDAVINTQTDVYLNTNGVGDFGYDPTVVGTIFGMKVNETKGPIQGESGVAVLKLNKKTDAPAVDKNYDVSSYKAQIEQKNQGRVQYYINEALKEITKTKDNRVRYF
jgi:peptidyl-prolyl cis-trans isomerase D